MDRVRSRNPNGAVKVPGRVQYVYSGQEYGDMVDARRLDMTPWDEGFPGWRAKGVYVVYFDLPFKTCTPKEWVEHAVKKGYSAEAAMNDYGSQCPELQSMCFPEDDLEIVHD